jgi:hypothetical protein
MDGALEKIVIPSKLKAAFLKHLHLMNVTGSSLFPGLDGLGKTVDDLVRLENLACTEIRRMTDASSGDSGGAE